MGAAEMVSIVGQKAVNQTSWQASEIDRQALSLDFSYLGEWEKSVCKNKLNCQSHYQSPITKEKITRCILEKKIDATTCISMEWVFFRTLENKMNYLGNTWWFVFFFHGIPSTLLCQQALEIHHYSPLYFVWSPKVSQQICPFVSS